jgi:lipoprotein-releasing system permease protein
MAGSTAPFSRFEWMIAWRYIRAKRAEGGVSVMTWISLIGVALAVFALIVTLAVRSGFRAEFVETVIGSNAHITVRYATELDEFGQASRVISDFAEVAARIEEVPGVVRASPVVRGQVLATFNSYNTFGDVYGIAPDDLARLPLIVDPEDSVGDISRFGDGVAIGSGVARRLGLGVGSQITLTSRSGASSPMGRSARVSTYEVVYIFRSGSYQTDLARIYMPLDQAQLYFNRDGVVDDIEVMLEDPEVLDPFIVPVFSAAGDRATIQTWRDFAGDYLRALAIEDNVMFVIMSVLVLVASMNIISGLIMLVKNKGRDIGILRTMGLSEGSVLRIFFICGAGIGTIGTIIGVVAGVAFVAWFDQIYALVDRMSGGDLISSSVRGVYELPAKLEWSDVVSAVGLSLGLSWIVTIFPARRAARMNPVEALRYA